MFHLTKVLTIFSTLLMVSCASGPSGKTFDSPIGVWSERWETQNGSMRSIKVTIVDEAKAKYGSNGRIDFFAIDEQGRWNGYWILEDGYRTCTEKKSGSQHWGETVFQFNETYSHYTGTWDYCGEGQKFSKSGVR